MSEQQYIELYEQARQMIMNHAPEPMNAVRDQAFEDFRRQGFPSRKVERYKYTDLQKLFEPDYGVNLNRLEIPVDPYQAFRCDVPNLSTNLYFVVNDAFFGGRVGAVARGCEDYIIGSLRDYPEIVAKYYARLAKTGEDAVTALNTMLAQDGMLVYVPKNVKVERAIQVINILKAPAPPHLRTPAPPLTLGVDFICFDAEDWGTPQWDDTPSDGDTWALGAQYWAANPHVDGYTARYGILLDMVGGQGAQFYQEQQSLQYARSIVDKVWRASQVVGFGSFFPSREGVGITDDHLPVNRVAKIPCIDIIPYYPDCPQSSFGPTWHTVNDDMAHIDRNTLQAVGQTLIQVLWSE